MAQYKRQHFVPVAYLKRFAVGEQRSATLRLDREGWVDCPIQRQCQKDYFFSKERPAESESQLEQGEALLRHFEAAAANHKYAGASVSLLLDLHFRSARYVADDQSDEERIEQYGRIWPAFLQRGVLGAVDYKVETDEWRELHYALQCSWKVSRFKDDGARFVTTDCPVALVSVNRKFAMILYAISPKELLVLFNYRLISTPKPKLSGAAFVNGANFQLALGCNKNVYSAAHKGKAETEALQYAQEQAINAPKAYWKRSEGKNVVNPHMNNFDGENPLFEYRLQEHSEPIVPYTEAKDRLHRGEIVFNPLTQQVTVKGKMSQSDFFCLYQLGLIPPMPKGGLA